MLHTVKTSDDLIDQVPDDHLASSSFFYYNVDIPVFDPSPPPLPILPSNLLPACLHFSTIFAPDEGQRLTYVAECSTVHDYTALYAHTFTMHKLTDTDTNISAFHRLHSTPTTFHCYAALLNNLI